ncbi:MAG: S1 RNA-binding domain-containing protein [Anaerolineae bacterium]
MSQEAEKEQTIVAEAPAEADTNGGATSVEAVESASVTTDEALDVDEADATHESQVVELAEAPDLEGSESSLVEAVADATDAPASAEAEEETEAVSEVEETTEQPEAVAPDAEQEPAIEEPTPQEAVVAEQKPKTEKKKREPRIHLSELEAGTEMTGRVVGIADFGAFVDIGAETDGLIHISELSDGRVNKVSDVVSIGQQVSLWIKDVDADQERISLSMRPKPKYRLRDLKPGMVVEGTVTSIRDYGVFVDIGAETEGLVHVSEMAEGFVNKPSELVSKRDDVEVRIKKVDRRRRRISLSMKGLGPSVPPPTQQSEEPLPTAMEVAMRRALGELEEEIEQTSDVQIGVEEASRDEMADRFSRMLREYRTDTENEA